MKPTLAVLLILLAGCPQKDESTSSPTRASARATPLSQLTSMVADDALPNARDDALVDVVRGFADAPAQASAEERAALFGLFKRLRVQTKKAKNRALYRELRFALVAMADPTWESALIRLLAAPIPAIEKKTFKRALDQVYWQTTAAEILGRLRSKRAVPALIAVVRSPEKSEVARSALDALARIGGTSVEAAAGILEEDPEPAARVLGHCGTLAAKERLLRAVESKSAAVKRAALGQLHRVPLDPIVIEKFKDNYAPAFVDQAALFFEPDMAAFVMKESRDVALGHALVAADAELWPEVERLFDEINATTKGADLAGRMKARSSAKALLDKCAAKVRCYKTELAAAGPASPAALRAAHMLGILRAPRPWIAEAALTTGHDGARDVLTAALIALSPRGDRDVANAIEAAYAKAKRERDIPKIAARERLVHAAIVLRARAEER